MTTTPDVAQTPASPSFQPANPTAPAGKGDNPYREINARRAELEKPHLLRTIRSL